ELVIGAVGDIRQISSPALRRIRLVLVDAVYAQAEPFEEGAVPFLVTAGEVIVDRYNMDPFAGEGVEVGRQGRHERLTLTGGHFRDLAFVEHGAADELHVIVN